MGVEQLKYTNQSLSKAPQCSLAVEELKYTNQSLSKKYTNQSKIH